MYIRYTLFPISLKEYEKYYILQDSTNPCRIDDLLSEARPY